MTAQDEKGWSLAPEDLLQNNERIFVLKRGASSPLFCYFFVKRLAQALGCQLVSFDCGQREEHELYAQCSMTFLGGSMLYWVKDIPALSTKQQSAVLTYLAQYQGPHLLCYASEEEPSSAQAEVRVIELEEKVTAKSYPAVFHFMHKKRLADEAFVQKVFRAYKHITLDAACVLAYYQGLLGQRIEEFIDEWLSRLVPQEQSLFILSQLFFSKDPQFVRAWSEMTGVYPEEFWVTYWSDQLWQATLFVEQARSGAQKSEVRYRLPFSFIQRDWRAYTVYELAQAHQFLYNVDYQSKNSSGTGGVDLFCLKFVSGHFKN